MANREDEAYLIKRMLSEIREKLGRRAIIGVPTFRRRPFLIFGKLRFGSFRYMFSIDLKDMDIINLIFIDNASEYADEEEIDGFHLSDPDVIEQMADAIEQIVAQTTSRSEHIAGAVDNGMEISRGS